MDLEKIKEILEEMVLQLQDSQADRHFRCIYEITHREYLERMWRLLDKKPVMSTSAYPDFWELYAYNLTNYKTALELFIENWTDDGGPVTGSNTEIPN